MATLACSCKTFWNAWIVGQSLVKCVLVSHIPQLLLMGPSFLTSLVFPNSMASTFLVRLAILAFTSSSSLRWYKPPLELGPSFHLSLVFPNLSIASQKIKVITGFIWWFIHKFTVAHHLSKLPHVWKQAIIEKTNNSPCLIPVMWACK